MSQIYEMAGHLIRRLNQISVSVFTKHMARIGVDITSVQYAALSQLETHPGIDQASLAAAIAYDRATLGGVIDRLERRRLIKRVISRKDRRARELHLTSTGRDVLNLARPVVQVLQDEILAGLNDREKAELIGLLKKTTAAGNSRSRAPLVAPGDVGGKTP